MDNMEEFSIGAMLPVVPLNSEKKENSLSDTSIEKLIDNTNEEINKDQDNIASKVVSKLFDSLDMGTDKVEESEESIDVEGLLWFEEDVDWTMESTKEIDEDIKDIIKTLNDKGYITKYSCSGHPSARFKRDRFRDGVLNKRLYSTARIVFAKDYDLPSIPKGWEMKVLDEDKVGIYVKPPTFKIMDGLPKEAFYKWKKKYMNALEKWVSDLPKFGEQNKTDEKEVVESTINDLMIDCL